MSGIETVPGSGSVRTAGDASDLTLSAFSEIRDYKDFDESSSDHSSVLTQFSRDCDLLRSEPKLTVLGMFKLLVLVTVFFLVLYLFLAFYFRFFGVYSSGN